MRLIDDTIGAPADAVDRAGAGSCQPRRSRWALRTCEAGDRERLLAEAGEYLAEALPVVG